MFSDRIHTTHVGSLVRTPAVAAYVRARQDNVAVDEDAYAAMLRSEVEQVVRRQSEAGIDIVNDGEYGKRSFHEYVVERMGGLEHRFEGVPTRAHFTGPERKQFAAFYAEYEPNSTVSRGAWFIVEPLTYRGHALLQRDIANLKRAIAGTSQRGFMTVIAPGSLDTNLIDLTYNDEEKRLFGIAGALREEYRAIADAGLILQIDDPWITGMHERLSASDYERWVDLRIAALNYALEGIPLEQTRYHLCWGSWNGPHVADVPLKDIVRYVFRVQAGAYSIEAANPRHEHEWRLWETVRLPEGKTLIPGLVSHATNVVEHPELVAERIVRIAKLVGRENVIAGTDCGFAQSALKGRVHSSIMWAKLESLTAGARLASAELWPRTET
jgi:5-methyltetrahydropteroyltriglutamate--homocysteine methyltransferase